MQNPQCLLCLVLIYFVSFKLFTRQILRYLSQHNNLGGGDWAGINKNVTDTFSSLTGIQTDWAKGDWAGINKNVTDTFSSLTGGPN